MEDSREPDSEQNEHLAAFRRFKKYRDRINPVVDSSVDIDKLINESLQSIKESERAEEKI